MEKSSGYKHSKFFLTLQLKNQLIVQQLGGSEIIAKNINTGTHNKCEIVSSRHQEMID
jgi:hypothetical protein